MVNEGLVFLVKQEIECPCCGDKIYLCRKARLTDNHETQETRVKLLSDDKRIYAVVAEKAETLKEYPVTRE